MKRRQIRPPKQQRSADSWNLILDAGVRLLLEEGRGALTVTRTCREAGVPPVTLYARVDGISGLFWAIYEREMAHVARTYRRLLDEAERASPGTNQRVHAVVGAVCRTFREHEPFLHQIINIAASDDALRERGSRESLVLVERMEQLLPAPRESARDVARMLHQECIFRAMYGDRWLSRKAESFAGFQRRMLRMSLARFAPQGGLAKQDA